MNRTLVIASRELRERSRIFLMAAGMAVLPFLAALLPAARMDRSMVIAGVGGFIGLALAFGVVVALGTSTVAGELVARRMSFYFSKPISPAAIWFGKALAALVTSALCFAIVAGPSFLATGNQWQRTFGGQRLLMLFGVMALALFLFSHTLSTIVRSRSALIGVDFLLAALTGIVVVAIVRPLLFDAPERAKTLLSIFGAAVLLVLFLAPVWQLARGRSDVRRSHAALSRAIWAGIAIVLLGAGAYAAWLVNVDPSDVTAQRIVQSPGSKAIFLGGTARGRGDYVASFLIDANSGRSERVSALAWWGEEFSRDGNVVAWLAPVWNGLTRAGGEIYTKRLDQPGARPRSTGISYGRAFSLSPDGSRLALLRPESLSVHEVGTERLIASVRSDTAPANAVAMFFVNNDVIRIYQWPHRSAKMEIFELDVRTKSLAKTGQVTSDLGFNDVRASADASRILVTRSGLVADGRTGAPIVQLPVRTNGRYHSAIMSDGTIAMIRRDGEQTKLFLFAADGTPRRQIVLPTYTQLVVGETDGNKLIVIGADKPIQDSARKRMTFVIDTARGTIERTLTGLRGPLPVDGDPRLAHYGASERLVAQKDDGRLVTWNAQTGEVRELLK